MNTRANRREFMSSAVSLAAMTAAVSVFGPSKVWGAINHKPLDPINPDILFGTTSSIWGRQHDIAWAIKRIAALGLQGIEPYPNNIEQYRKNPMALKKLFDDAGVTFIDCSNGAQGQSTNFIDPAQTPKTIADHVAFARDFLQPLGATLWKCNMGQRPAGGPSDDQLKRLAEHAERDRPADDCDGDSDGAASAHLGTDRARARSAPHDGADRSQTMCG